MNIIRVVKYLLNLLFNLIFNIISMLIQIIVAIFGLVKNLFTKNSSTGQNRVNKEQLTNYLKTHKKGVTLTVIVVGILLIALDNMFYTPPSRDSYDSYNSSYNYSNHYVDDDCDECYGTGNCTFCNGSGIIRSYGVEVECKACDGWGNCFRCGGTGNK